jgi:hypothetical protein
MFLKLRYVWSLGYNIVRVSHISFSRPAILRSSIMTCVTADDISVVMGNYCLTQERNIKLKTSFLNQNGFNGLAKCP